MMGIYQPVLNGTARLHFAGCLHEISRGLLHIYTALSVGMLWKGHERALSIVSMGKVRGC